MKFSLYLQLNEVELFIILKERQIGFVGNFSFDIDQKPTKKREQCTSLPPISYALIENEMSFEVQISYKIIDNCNCFVFLTIYFL